MKRTTPSELTVGRQEEHLRLPTVRTQRPAVTEYDGLTQAPVLVIDLCAVFGSDRVHVLFLLPDVVFFPFFESQKLLASVSIFASRM